MAFYLLIFGGLIQFIGGLLYIRTMLHGSTKANRVPWFLVALSAFTGTAAALYEGAGWSVLPGFMSGFAPFCIFCASFLIKDSYWKSTAFDYLCGFLSILGIILWIFTSNGVIALVFAIIADFFASIPLLVKSWKYPETESSFEFQAALFSSILSMFVLESSNFVEWGFSIYLIFMCSALIFSVERKKLLRNL